MKYFRLNLAVLLLLCLLHLPYGYYVLVRFVAAVGFAVFAYDYYEKHQKSLAVAFGALALLFQPFVKIALGRVMWNVVDVVAAIILVGFVVKENIIPNKLVRSVVKELKHTWKQKGIKIKRFSGEENIINSMKRWPERVKMTSEKCPICGSDVVSFYYSYPPKAWRDLAGRAGTMKICPRCGESLSFRLEVMS